MAQDDYGAAQPIVDVFRNAARKGRRLLGDVPAPKKSEPNATVRALNQKSEDDWRKQVAASFYAQQKATPKKTTKRTATKKSTRRK